MLVDFTVAPASKVDVEDRVERAKDSRNEQQERLDTLRFQRTQAPVSVVVENP